MERMSDVMLSGSYQIKNALLTRLELNGDSLLQSALREMLPPNVTDGAISGFLSKLQTRGLIRISGQRGKRVIELSDRKGLENQPTKAKGIGSRAGRHHKGVAFARTLEDVREALLTLAARVDELSKQDRKEPKELRDYTGGELLRELARRERELARREKGEEE